MFQVAGCVLALVPLLKKKKRCLLWAFLRFEGVGGPEPVGV